MPRLLVVDDDRLMLRSLEKLFAQEGYFCKTAQTVEEARRELSRTAAHESFDLILLDLGLPDGDGVSFCRQIRTSHRMPILLLTARDQITDKVIGLEVGADDYLTKPFDPRELLARTRAHLRRSAEYITATAPINRIEVGSLLVDLDAREVRREGDKLHLTEREFELLHLLARHPGKALASEWMFEQIWGYSPELGIKTLTVYVRRLREKIEVDPPRPKVLLTVRGFGYKLVAPEKP